jgi:1-acyl-sn-glycerol-3-phosphate acyltransferase
MTIAKSERKPNAMKRFVGLLLSLVAPFLFSAVPGATAGAIVGAILGNAGRGAWIGILVGGVLILAERVAGMKFFHRHTPEEQAPKPSRPILSFMINASGFLVMGALASVILGAPAAILGVGVALVMHGTIFFDSEIAYAVGGSVCVARLGYWYWIGRKLQIPGYLQPYPTRFERILYVWLCRQILRLSLGPVWIYGQERAKFDGRLIIGQNHQSGADFLIARAIMPFSFRQITQMRQLQGMQGCLGAFSGAFGVHSEGGRSKGDANTVIDACGSALATAARAKLLIYPQGKLIPKLIQEDDFRTGVIRIMKKTVELTGDDRIAFLPGAIYYWETKSKPGFLRRFLGKGWVAFDGDRTPKYGATVVMGDPIAYANMPRIIGTDGKEEVDARAAVNMICASVIELYAEAKVRSERGTNKLVDALKDINVSGSGILKLFEAGLFEFAKLKGTSAEALVAAGLSPDDAAKVKASYAS